MWISSNVTANRYQRFAFRSLNDVIEHATEPPSVEDSKRDVIFSNLLLCSWKTQLHNYINVLKNGRGHGDQSYTKVQ